MRVGMDASAMTRPAADAVEQQLRDELAEGNSALVSACPLLRQLVAQAPGGLLSDALVAHIRGMALDVARQLAEEQGECADQPDAGRHGQLAAALVADNAFLGHCLSLAIEGQVASRLAGQFGIDPVLTPLVKDLAASSERAQAALAMAVLAAQARFFQYHRRMELPLRDLPADVFHRALLVLREHAGSDADTTERRLRAAYSESDGRLALLARLVTGLGAQTSRALALADAGPSLFASALALASSQDREQALLGFTSGQAARLVLALRAAGLSRDEAAEQFSALNPEGDLPVGFDQVPAENAAAVLGAAAPEGGH